LVSYCRKFPIISCEEYCFPIIEFYFPDYISLWATFVLPVVIHQGHRGRDRMVVGFTPISSISAYRHMESSQLTWEGSLIEW
jgi:hypothetical protein